MQYKYGKRAVAFLDVLGFQQKLIEFEQEALKFKEKRTTPKFVSQAANEFINTFLSVIERLDGDKYRYYLFSDNICITSVTDISKNDLQDFLIVIADMYYEFAKKGYYLRGGVDYGFFID